MKKSFAASALFLACAGSAMAQFTIDGTKDVTYPASTVFQTAATGFGDSTAGTFAAGNGSELDGAFADVTGTDLFLMLTGNLESSFNKLSIFIDANNGGPGQNALSGMNGFATNYNGMTFDTGFNAGFMFSFTHGNTTNAGANSEMYMDMSVFDGTNWTSAYMGRIDVGSGNAPDWNVGGGGSQPAGFQAMLNNSNTAGVTGSSVTGAELVSTGLEVKIPLTMLGNTTWGNNMKIAAMINGANHDYLSNQVLGGFASGQGNLGGDGTGAFTGNVGGINFSQYAGNQYFAVPEPASMAALGLGLVGFFGKRKRK